MPPLRLALLLAVLAAPVLHAGKASIEDGRFSLEFPADWKKAEGPDDGALLYRESPDRNGSFSVYTLKVTEDHKADLDGTLETFVKQAGKRGLSVAGEIQKQKQEFDGKAALFGMVPMEVKADDNQKVAFTFYLVLLDAKDRVVVMKASLPRPAKKELREAALGIIQSFREKE